MRVFVICLLFFIILLFAIVFGAHASSDSSDPAPDNSNDPSINSPLPLNSPKRDSAIVAAPDGTIYLVKLSSGKIIWSFASGASIYSSYQALPSQNNDKLDTSAEGDNFYIDCGEDWELYLHGDGFKKKLRLSPDDFLKRTPYISDSGGVMLSSKKTSVFLVDANTGKIIRTIRSDNLSSIENQDIEENPIIPKQDFDQYTKSVPGGKLIYIMRTDYSMKYASSKTGKTLWYLKFANIEASFKCEGIEKFVDEKVDLKLPLNCDIIPSVYRIRDRTSLETLFISGGFLNSLPGKKSEKLLSLPESDNINLLGPLEKFFRLHQNKEEPVVLALPTTKIENNVILGLPGVNNGQISASVIFSAFLPLVLPFLFFIGRFIVGKRGKSEDIKLQTQTVTPKKKKTRKANIKNDSSDKKVNELSDLTKTERNLQINFTKGFIDGRKIGKLVLSSKEIAKGSNGTIVLEGYYDGRPVAVKRLVQTHHDVALKEIQNLIASDQHPNIVRWYGVEYDQDFVYLSLERCTCSLDGLISSYSQKGSDNNYNDTLLQYIDEDDKDFKLWTPNGYPSPQLLKLMRNIVSGIAHLHELGIVHRDLKPQNVLVLKERSICAKISDMGISKRLAGNMSSLTKHSTGYGSSGWQAPEQLRNERQTRAVDLFSLGCVLFFCITGGEHPYGGIWERDGNIFRNQKDLFLIESIPEAKDIISRLLDPVPELRPKPDEILLHPLFWDSEARLSFIRDASDRVELEDRLSDSELLDALESIGSVVFGSKWGDRMESTVINDIGRYRRYKFDSVRDLLRVIRNKMNHYRELAIEAQEILGSVPDGFDGYFSSRFPNLLIEVYKVIQSFCAEENNFRKYFVIQQS